MNTLLLSLALAAGQCSGGSCRAPSFTPVTVPITLAPVVADGWHQFNADEWRLWQGGRMIGGYRVSDDTYIPLLNGIWGKPQAPPSLPPGIAAKAPAGGAQPHWATHGVQTDQIAPVERTTVNGQEVRKDHFMGTVGADVPDDSKLARLSVLGGSEGQRKQVLQDLKENEQLLSFKQAVAVKAAPADHWSVKDNGFVANPQDVTLYLQQPDGKVIWRQDGYPGPMKLAEGLRRVRPDYNPAKDPPMIPHPLGVDDDTLWLVAGGAAVVLLLLLRK